LSSQVRGVVARAKLRLERARARYGFVDIAFTTLKRYSEDDGGSYAAALTYYTFFSIFPLAVFGLAVLGYVTFGNVELRRDIIDAGLEAAPLLGSILEEEALSTLEARRNQLALTGFVLALYSGSGAVVALEHALNKLNHVAQEPNFVAKRLRSLAWLGVLGLAVVGSVALSALARFTGRIFDALGPAGTLLTSLLFTLAGMGVSTTIFATAYKFLPRRPLSWRDVLPGAVLAALAFEVLKLAGGTYLGAGAQNRAATFGAFATAAGLLVASYLISQVTLLAAEVNVVLAERRITRQAQSFESQGGTT
jgi:membrane protein